jgi:DNA-binding transcriptional LysR family regulator
MIDRDTLGLLPTFLAVAETASFTAAAARLGVSASAASQSVRLLEQKLGHPLFRRTTRSVSLTEEGESLLRRAHPALRELGLALEIAASARRKPSGLLRLNVPRAAMPMVIEPILPVMRERYPDLAIEIYAEDASIDIVEQGFDAGIRVGNMTSPDMISVNVSAPMTAILVASPRYIERRGQPRSVGDLQQHECIGYRMGGSKRLYDWQLMDGKTEVTVAVPSPIIINDSLFTLSLALSGFGIGYIFDALAQPYLDDGTLVQVLPKAAIKEPPLAVYFPRYANEQPKLRAFIDVAREVLRRKRKSLKVKCSFRVSRMGCCTRTANAAQYIDSRHLHQAWFCKESI